MGSLFGHAFLTRQPFCTAVPSDLISLTAGGATRADAHAPISSHRDTRRTTASSCAGLAFCACMRPRAAAVLSRSPHRRERERAARWCGLLAPAVTGTLSVGFFQASSTARHHSLSRSSPFAITFLAMARASIPASEGWGAAKPRVLPCDPVSWYSKTWLTETSETLFSSPTVCYGRECTPRQLAIVESVGAFARVVRVAPAVGEARRAPRPVVAGRPIAGAYQVLASHPEAFVYQPLDLALLAPGMRPSLALPIVVPGGS
jgi:hypothetical protein